jgi:hypothetical protein
MLLVVALSGCSGKKGGGDSGGEPSPADAAAKEYDSAIGNEGYRITGSLTGTANPLGADSAVRLDILDVVDDDSGGALDKANFVLDAKETGLNVQASLKSMATGADAFSSADHHGGAERNVKVFGTTGVGPSQLPEATAYLFAVGYANVKVGDAGTARRLVYVAVTGGLRDASHAALPAPDENNLQMHVVFPGSTMNGVDPVAGVPEGFLYYYFESVGLSQLSDEERGKVGASLAPPEKANMPPVADGKVLVGGKTASTAVQERLSNASVPVVFDGSASTDDGGSISRWVWRVFEVDSNGTYQRPKDDPAVVQGETAKYNFTRAGPKQINLTVVDTQGASDTFLISFYVDFHSKVPGGGSLHSQAPAGAPVCQDSVNCFKHLTFIQPGFVSATYTIAKNGSQSSMTNTHIELYAPGKDFDTADPIKEAANGPLTVAAADLKGVTGSYTVRVWYEASTSVGGADGMTGTNDGIYDLDSKIGYTPKV